MKQFILLSILCFSVCSAISQTRELKISATVFKHQEFCRAELKDFEWDVRYSVVSANVYFSGANFNKVELGNITSNSLKPLEALMKRCIPGSIVVFDDVKVVGPDKQVKPIAGLSLVLR